MGFVLDSGGEVGVAINKAPTEIDLYVSVNGKKAHSGVNPEDGVDAIKNSCYGYFSTVFR